MMIGPPRRPARLAWRAVAHEVNTCALLAVRKSDRPTVDAAVLDHALDETDCFDF
jgi:hypothetical protein